MHPKFVTDESDWRYRRACQSRATGVSSGLRLQCKPTTLFFERADGPYYHDVAGYELIDSTLAWGSLVLGSSHPAINAAVTRQLGRFYILGARHDGETELAELMARSLSGVEQVVFCNTGSEAVQAAIRLALLDRGVHAMLDGRRYVGAGHTDRELAKTSNAIELAMEEITCQH